MRLLSFVFAAASLVFSQVVVAGDDTTVYADVEIKLEGAKATKASAGIRTLFITIYDSESKAPMPYGAMKVELDKDAKGTVYKGKLDASNIMVMGGGASPQTLRIKAKLDKDGSAGPDAAGDVVGIVDGVKVGSKVTIKLDKAI
jgi:hypothetical protein